MEKRSFALHKTPVYIMYLLGFIIYDNPRRKWIFQSLRIIVVALHTCAFIFQIMFCISIARVTLDGSATGFLIFYSSLVSGQYKQFFLFLFIKKSVWKRRIQIFLDSFLVESLHSSVKLKYTAAILLHTAMCFIFTSASIVLIVKNVYIDVLFRDYKVANVHFENISKIIAAMQALHAYLFFPLFSSMIAFVCLKLCSTLKSIKYDLMNTAKKTGIYTENSFSQFLENFYQIERLFIKLNDLFSFDFAFFLSICVNDLVINFFLVLYLGRCGFPAEMLGVSVGLSVVNFFLFVMPCCYLYSQVTRQHLVFGFRTLFETNGSG